MFLLLITLITVMSDLPVVLTTLPNASMYIGYIDVQMVFDLVVGGGGLS